MNLRRWQKNEEWRSKRLRKRISKAIQTYQSKKKDSMTSEDLKDYKKKETFRSKLLEIRKFELNILIKKKLKQFLK